MSTPETQPVHLSGWCLDARSGHFRKLAPRMHEQCAERLADPTKKPDECGCSCHEGGDAA